MPDLASIEFQLLPDNILSQEISREHLCELVLLWWSWPDCFLEFWNDFEVFYYCSRSLLLVLSEPRCWSAVLGLLQRRSSLGDSNARVLQSNWRFYVIQYWICFSRSTFPHKIRINRLWNRELCVAFIHRWRTSGSWARGAVPILCVQRKCRSGNICCILIGWIGCCQTDPSKPCQEIKGAKEAKRTGGGPAWMKTLNWRKDSKSNSTESIKNTKVCRNYFDILTHLNQIFS